MMRLMIAADLHGSAYYCKKLSEQFSKEKCDKILLLGDILYHGPRNDLPKDYQPKAVIEMLNAMADKILCVRGNCDTEVDQMVLKFPIMAEYCYLCVNGLQIFATHGHHYNEQCMPPLTDGEILIHGHTHVPVCIQKGQNMIMNPGSVSIPKENSHHGYMILEQGRIVWKDIEGNEVMDWKYTL